jgi:hypothetical protein
MSRLTWDKVSGRLYENGIDQGVLYLSSGVAVPWSGLTAVDEKPQRNVNPVYFDGRKLNNGVTPGDFSATLSAVTYPDEIEELEGATLLRTGVLVKDQPPKTFALCYRTMIANAATGEAVGYKIHVIWNVTAIPTDRSYASLSDDPEIVEFQWDLVAVPEELPGMRPTAHVTIDTRKLDPWFLEELEQRLYGGTFANASLLSMPEFFTFLNEWYRVRIVDNGDGTWSAIEARPGFITFNVDMDIFTIIKVKAFYISEDEYIISDTEGAEQYSVEIEVSPDGIWSATTDNDAIIDIEDDVFQIRAIEVDFAGPDMYRISSQNPNQ